jgi:4-hydroxy-2-oxoheptanedioate aldolase
MLIERGARFLCHGADILMVKAGLEAIRREYAGLGITFDDRIGEMIARSAAPASK